MYKIRYDLLENQCGNHYNENNIFDKYSSLLDLDYKEMILCNAPLLSHDHHRMVYISSNQKLLKPKRIIILPYLHERKIYLNQIEMNHKYFYNVVEERDIGDSDNSGDQQMHTLIFAINCTKHNYQVYSERGLLLRVVKYEDMVRKYGLPIDVSSDGLKYLF